jgi:hypothetical protein
MGKIMSDDISDAFDMMRDDYDAEIAQLKKKIERLLAGLEWIACWPPGPSPRDKIRIRNYARRILEENR